MSTTTTEGKLSKEPRPLFWLRLFMPWSQSQRSISRERRSWSSYHCFKGYQLYIAEAFCTLSAFVVNCSKTSWWWTARDMVLRHYVKSRPNDPHSMPLVNWVRSGDLRKKQRSSYDRKPRVSCMVPWCRKMLASSGRSIWAHVYAPQMRGIFHLGWTCPHATSTQANPVWIISFFHDLSI